MLDISKILITITKRNDPKIISPIEIVKYKQLIPRKILHVITTSMQNILTVAKRPNQNYTRKRLGDVFQC